MNFLYFQILILPNKPTPKLAAWTRSSIYTYHQHLGALCCLSSQQVLKSQKSQQGPPFLLLCHMGFQKLYLVRTICPDQLSHNAHRGCVGKSLLPSVNNCRRISHYCVWVCVCLHSSVSHWYQGKNSKNITCLSSCPVLWLRNKYHLLCSLS